MEKNPFEIKFHNEFVSLIENLLKILRRDRNLTSHIKQYYTDYRSKDRFNFIHQTVETLESHIEKVRQHDESLFLEADNIYLLPKLDFKIFWGSEFIEPSHKATIWKYLTNLYILGCHYIHKNDAYFQEMLNSIKVHQMLERQVEQEEADEASRQGQSEQLGIELQRLFKGLFAENSFVYEIVNLDEVQELIQAFKSKPLETIKRFMINKGLISELCEGIANKIKTKLINGELDRSKIDQDIEKIKRIIEKLKKDLPRDKRFQKIFDTIKRNFNIDITGDSLDNPESVMQKFAEQIKSTTGLDLNEIKDESPERFEDILKRSIEKTEHALNISTPPENANNTCADNTNNGEASVEITGLVSAINEIIQSTIQDK